MATDKKEYKSVLMALLGHKMLPTTINKLMEAWVSTEDEKFKKDLGAIIGHLKNELLNQTTKSRSYSINASLQPYKPLVDYCHNRIVSTKPQWQFLAEKNGWGPKG